MENLLGKKAKSKVSGFEGVVTARCEYLYTPARVCLTGKSENGKVPEDYWTEEADIEIVDNDNIERNDPVFQS